MHEGVLKISKFYEVTASVTEHCFRDGQQIDFCSLQNFLFSVR